MLLHNKGIPEQFFSLWSIKYDYPMLAITTFEIFQILLNIVYDNNIINTNVKLATLKWKQTWFSCHNQSSYKFSLIMFTNSTYVYKKTYHIYGNSATEAWPKFSVNSGICDLKFLKRA